MDEIQDLLTEWGLSEIYNSFVENNIDVETFHQLNENDIKELIPAIGTRKKFSQKYQQYLIEKAVINLDQQASAGDDNISESTTETVSSNNSAISILDYDQIKPQLHYYPLKATVGQPYEITPIEGTSQINSVSNLLETTEEGKIIKNSYGPFKKFRRSSLCNLITKHELQNSPDKRISTERFKILAQEINNIFIHEEAAIYYVPYTKGVNGKVVAASGKLWSAYVHQRKILRETGLLKKKGGEPSTSASLVLNENEEIIEDDDMTEILTWLRHNSIPYEEVVERWRKSAASRLQHKSEETIEEYYQKFPALSLQTGYLLLELDFTYMHTGKENALFLRWPTLAIPIYDTLTKKNDALTKNFVAQEKEKFETIDDDVKQIIALKLLPLLLQSPLIKAKTNAHWKPSRTEMLDGFILFIDNASNLTKKLEERRLKCQNLKTTAQPIPIVVGTYKSYQCFVSVNEQLYKVEDPLKAVDICFKVYHALNANYPQESTPAWLFVQKGIYNIHTNFDQKYRSVDVLLATIKAIIG